MEPQSLLVVALEAARAAVAVHRRHAGRVRVEDWSEKRTADFVTHVDREAEAEIVARITRAFPDHHILAEESASADGVDPAARDAEWLWIVDPLDGTTNFLHGFPAYCASVGVAHRGQLMAGAIVDGVTGEAWTATHGGGSFKDGEPIRVSALEDLRLALVGTGFPYRYGESIPEYLRQFDAIMRVTAGIRRPGSAALDLCHVAAGHFDVFWEQKLSPWDFAAGALLVREAGGVVTNFRGQPDVLRGPDVLAGNPMLHAQLQQIIAGAETAGTGEG